MKNNKLHILIIVLGTILLLIPAFHSNIWFDESYSVALVQHSFSEIWTIGSYDVHPILYYWILKIINIIFGANIIAYRVFSVLGIVALGIIGLTHISKDFGKKVGILFTFFSMFLPVMLNYALEIRMYSWTITTVTLMAIYLYRFINKRDTKNLILFGIFSIISCYMHYYALMCAGIMNLGLIIYVITKRKEIEKKQLIKFFVVEAIQVLLYLPWLFIFIRQATRVGSGFWITVEYPQILIDVLNFQFKGNLEQLIPTIFAGILMAYVIYVIIKNIIKKEKIWVGIIPLVIYLSIIIIAAIISIKSPILYARYLFPITGLLIFAISYFMAKDNNKYIIGIVCIVILIMSAMNFISVIKENYDKTNTEPISYLKDNLKPDDIIAYTDIVNGGVVASLIDSNKQYFLNVDNWSIEEAYKAYAPQMGIAYKFEDLENLANGRIVIVDPEDDRLYNNLKESGKYKEVSSKSFKTKYKNYTYHIRILEKN